MAKLTKAAAALHEQACGLVELDRTLTDDERLFVLQNWQESANTVNNLIGAYFTPVGLARDLAIDVQGPRIIDLGAGIGALTWACRALNCGWPGQQRWEFVCVERNPAYVAVGRKVLPEATWICADVFDVPDMDIGVFDTAIANPPFGRIRGARRAPRYTGPATELRFIDIARDIAGRGVFIVPQTSAPFRHSGRPGFEEDRGAEYKRFAAMTGIELEQGLAIDTALYANDWRGAAPCVEIVTCDFDEARERGGSRETLW